jgi:large subunit ribosomal protein L1
MAKLSKRAKIIAENFDREATYTLDDALAKVKEFATAKFDESVDMAINLGVDPRKAEQNIRGVATLPHGTGKTVRVAVFARDEQANAAREAGADIVGAEDLVEMIQKGEMNFDRCVATPDMMALVGRVAKILGPKGLMPNPKLGTVTPKVAEAVKAVKAGQVEYRVEKTGIIHVGIGKASFSKDQLKDNVSFIVDIVQKARPNGFKGTYLNGMVLNSTMGPGVRFTVDN